MKREVRAHLAARHYQDVDFVNCHPVILEQVLERHRIPCPLLTKYVEGREECVAEVMSASGVTRDSAKALFIRLVFLGSVEAWLTESSATGGPPSWVYQLRNELHDNAERLVVRSELDDIRRARINDVRTLGRPLTTHALASVMSIYLQTLERRCLDALHDAIKRDGFEVGALIYDGLLVRKTQDSLLPKSILKTWRAHVLCTAGYDIEIKVKPLDTDPSWLEPYCVPKGPTDLLWDDSWMDGSALMTYPQMKAVWEQRALKVTVCGDYMREEREKHAVYTRRKLIDAYEHLKFASIKYDERGEGRLSKHVFINAWVADEEIRACKYMDIYPPPLECPDHTYNMWNGFAVSKYTTDATINTDSVGVQAFIAHIHVMMNRDQRATEYVLDWIAQLFQQPSRKTGIALLLKGTEGAGKNRLTDLLKLMLGDGLFLETAKPASINPDSRRYVVFEVSSELKGNTAYFKTLSGHIADEHARFEFYQYLMQRNIEDVDWINSRPLTEYYDRMVELNLPREHQFIRDAVVMPAYTSGEASVEKTSTQLFEAFQKWLADSSSGIYSTNTTKFGQRLTDLVNSSDAMPGVSKPLRSSYKAYAFDIETIVHHMVARKWLAASDVPQRL